MHIAAMTLVGSLALAAIPAPANAAPAVPSHPAAVAANLIEVSGGCGPAFYRNAWGYCMPNPYGSYWYGGYRPYWGYYNPYWRFW